MTLSLNEIIQQGIASEEEDCRESVVFLTYRDILTGTYNRLYVEKAIPYLDKKDWLPITLMVGNVDGLDTVNDVLGYDYGDVVLQKAVKMFGDYCKEDSIIARWDGDGFLVILPQTTMREAEELSYHLMDEIIPSADSRINCKLALGLATKDALAQEAFDLIKKAKLEIYRNKLIRKYVVFNEELGGQAQMFKL